MSCPLRQYQRLDSHSRDRERVFMFCKCSVARNRINFTSFSTLSHVALQASQQNSVVALFGSSIAAAAHMCPSTLSVWMEFRTTPFWCSATADVILCVCSVSALRNTTCTHIVCWMVACSFGTVCTTLEAVGIKYSWQRMQAVSLKQYVDGDGCCVASCSNTKRISRSLNVRAI